MRRNNLYIYVFSGAYKMDAMSMILVLILWAALFVAGYKFKEYRLGQQSTTFRSRVDPGMYNPAP